MKAEDFETQARALAHELRNPLNAMRLNLEMLREDLRALGADAETLEIADAIGREIDQLAAIATAFRDFASSPALRVEEVELAELCLDLAAFLKPQLRESGVRLECDCRPSPVEGDRTLLRQAVLNLLLNALAACGKGGLIRCRCRPEGGARVTISDDGPGPGPDPEAHFKLFSSTRPDGTGVGLPLARKVARLHGGDVTLEAGPGGGAIAELTLGSRPPARTAD
ncbi:MAG TPA: HAMP domain-containing sensor histidine kinase [bacterium]|nr:HAMP domain-containing sensor histidine kinase [bacterium]